MTPPSIGGEFDSTPERSVCQEDRREYILTGRDHEGPYTIRLNWHPDGEGMDDSWAGWFIVAQRHYETRDGDNAPPYCISW